MPSFCFPVLTIPMCIRLSPSAIREISYSSKAGSGEGVGAGASVCAGAGVLAACGRDWDVPGIAEPVTEDSASAGFLFADRLGMARKHSKKRGKARICLSLFFCCFLFCFMVWGSFYACQPAPYKR